jgi:hypothetical protein
LGAQSAILRHIGKFNVDNGGSERVEPLGCFRHHHLRRGIYVDVVPRGFDNNASATEAMRSNCNLVIATGEIS